MDFNKLANSKLDILHEVTISYETALRGATKQLTVPFYIDCENCGGIGSDKKENIKICNACNSTGLQKIKKTKLFSTYFEEVTCMKCEGVGRIVRNPCPVCLGFGKIQNSKTLAFVIPPNSRNGQVVKKIGFGHTSPKGGYDGDLVIVLNVMPPTQKR